jgi:hypothetical protein
MVCKIPGFHGGDYEECSFLGHKNAVRTSQETHYIPVTEPSRLNLCNIWGFHGGDYEECRLLGYETLFLTFNSWIGSDRIGSNQLSQFFSNSFCSGHRKPATASAILQRFLYFSGGNHPNRKLRICFAQCRHKLSAGPIAPLKQISPICARNCDIVPHVQHPLLTGSTDKLKAETYSRPEAPANKYADLLTIMSTLSYLLFYVFLCISYITSCMTLYFFAACVGW